MDHCSDLDQNSLRQKQSLVGSCVSTSEDYGIDPLNRRISDSQRGFVYGTGNQVLAELDANGDVVSRFVYATKGHVPDLMYSNKPDGTWRWYRFVTDWRGSVRAVVDAVMGNTVQRIDYTPFGRVISDSNRGLQPFGFAGGLYDSNTGLVRFGARDYDPLTGRWTNKDPIRFRGGDANLYVYVGNDPVNFIDPLGLLTEVIFWDPVGWGSSSFGHVSVMVDDTSYSFGPSGMYISSRESYLKRNSFRSGYGLILQSLSAEQEKTVEERLTSYDEEYNFLTNNCGDPIETILEDLGYDLGINLRPQSLQWSINQGTDAGFVYRMYPASNPGSGTSAPWAK